MDALGVVVRFGLYLDLTTAFGVPFFALCFHTARRRLPLRGVVLTTATLGFALSALGLASAASTMAGVPLSQVAATDVMAVLTGMSLGTAWMVRIAGLLVLAASAAAFRRRPAVALWLASAGGAAALSSLAWGGHGVMNEGSVGWIHLGADVLHIAAAGVWIGALVCLLLLASRPVQRVDAAHLFASHEALEGFSDIGTAVVAVIVATGVVNGWLLVGPANLAALPSTLYGQLLIAKLLLFATMLGLAATNRYRLTPALKARLEAGSYDDAMARLRVSVAVETACAVAVLALVAWLGTLEPVASAM